MKKEIYTLFFLSIISLFFSNYAMELDRSLVTFPITRDYDCSFKIQQSSGVFSVTVQNQNSSHMHTVDFLSPAVSEMQAIEQYLIRKDFSSNNKDVNQGTSYGILENSLFLQYLQQRNYIVNQCINALKHSYDALFELPTLAFSIPNEESSSSELNTIVQKPLTQLIDIFYDADGALTIPSVSKQYDEAAYALGIYLMQFHSYNECVQLAGHYKNDRVPGFKSFENYLKGRLSFTGFFTDIKYTSKSVWGGCVDWYRGKGYFASRCEQINANRFTQDLKTVKQLYFQSDFERADVLINRHKVKKNKPNIEEMRRNVVIDRYLRQLNKISPAIKSLRSIQEQYKKQSICIDYLSQRLQSDLSRDSTRDGQIIVAKFLIKALHKMPYSLRPSINEKRFDQAYNAFFDKRGLPVFFKYNEEVLSQCTIPETMGNFGHVQERLALFKLASLLNPERSDNNKLFKEAITNAIYYINAALNDRENAFIYRMLADALYRALISEETQAALLLECPNFTPRFKNSNAQKVHTVILDHVRMVVASMNHQLLPEQKIILEDSLKALGRLWTNVCVNKDQAYKKIETMQRNRLEEGELYIAQTDGQTENFISISDKRFKESATDLLLTNNCCCISVRDFQEYEEYAKHLHFQEEGIPNLNTLKKILDDRTTPRMITALLHDALVVWRMATTSLERETATLATHCGEVAYTYAKNDDDNQAEFFTSLGNQLLKYAYIAGNVIVAKGTELANLTRNLVLEKSPQAAKYALQACVHALDPLCEAANSLVNCLKGKGFYSPVHELERQFGGSPFQEPLAYREAFKRAINSGTESLGNFGKTTGTLLLFLARIAGADAPEYSDVQWKMNVESMKAITGYVNQFIALPHEKQFEKTFDFALDNIIQCTAFWLCGKLYRILRLHGKKLASLSRISQADQILFEEAFKTLQEAEVALVDAAEKVVVPNVMKSEGAVVDKSAKVSKRAAESFVNEIKEFIVEVKRLEHVYGTHIVQEAVNILNLNNELKFNKLFKWRKHNKVKETMAELVERITKGIIKIDSNPRWKPFRFDAGQKGKCTLNSIEEALAAIACEEQGLLKNITRKIREEGVDFIDHTGKVWDVKTAHSFSLEGEYIFEKKSKFKKKGKIKFFDSLKKGLLDDPDASFIVNISYLHEIDHVKFYKGLKNEFLKKDIERMIIIDANNIINTKTTTELLNFLKF